MSKIDFVWDLTDENFRRMMAKENTPDVFGSLYFGDYLVEFRCSGGGMDAEDCDTVVDIFYYGKEDVTGDYYLADGTPYTFLDYSFSAPKRRTLDAFKRTVEKIITDAIGVEPELTEDGAICFTLTKAEWNPKLTLNGEIRVPTRLGTIVVEPKGENTTSGYPGVNIYLDVFKMRYDIAMIECDQDVDTNDEFPLLKCHIYNDDPNRDDPIYSYTTDAEKIGMYLKSFKGGKVI